MADYLRESGVKWLWERIKTLLSAKQDKLVSGTNIKTINGTSLLGEGNVSIEGGGDFDSSGTYPNLTAGKATKLATARTISLSGGASGSVSFDGSANKSLNVTGLNESYLSFGGRTITSNISPIDACMGGNLWNNRASFMSPESIIIEYSRDGGQTWLPYSAISDSNKPSLVTTGFIAKVYAGMIATAPENLEDVTLYKARITLDINASNRYYSLNKILIRSGANPAEHANTLLIEGLYRVNSQWYQIGEMTLGGDAAWNSFALPTSRNVGNGAHAYYRQIRLTLSQKTLASSRRICFISNIYLLGTTLHSTFESLPCTGHLYSYDLQQNATFPAAVTATKHVTQGGTNQQVVLGDGSLKALSEISPITDADADILLDNHIHSINVKTNGNYVNISVIESSKNGNTWETEDNDIPIPLATTTSAGLMSKDMYSALKDGFIANIVEVTTNGNSVELSYDAAYPNSDGTFNMMEGEGVEIPLATTTSAGVMSKEDKAKLDELGSNVAIEPDSGMPDFIGDFEYSSVDYEAIIDLTTVDWIDWVEGGLYLMNAEETWEEDNGDTSYHQCVVTFIYRANGCIPLSIVNTNKMTAKMSGMVITINLTEGTGELRFKQIKLI